MPVLDKRKVNEIGEQLRIQCVRIYKGRLNYVS